MKIAISSSGPDMSGPMDARFGRAEGFIIFDTESEAHEYVDNTQNLSLAQGAGIQAAQNVAATGAEAVITGHVGPKAYKALSHGGIGVYLGSGGPVRELIEAYKGGRLQAATGPDKDGHW